MIPRDGIWRRGCVCCVPHGGEWKVLAWFIPLSVFSGARLVLGFSRALSVSFLFVLGFSVLGFSVLENLHRR